MQPPLKERTDDPALIKILIHTKFCKSEGTNFLRFVKCCNGSDISVGDVVCLTLPDNSWTKIFINPTFDHL